MKTPLVIGLLCFSVFLAVFLTTKTSIAAQQKVVVGSKIFTESYILGEIVAKKLELSQNKADNSTLIERRLGIGATGILFEALLGGDISMYPEYTGTIAEAILKRPDLKTFDEIQNALKPLGLTMSQPLGFNNTYALAVRTEVAQKFKLTRISDLAPVLTEIRIGFGHEFTTRSDGSPGLAAVYKIPFASRTRAMAHSLAYEAIREGSIDLTDVYSTDSKIESLGLLVLEDDLNAFPRYDAVILVRSDFVTLNPGLWSAIQSLAGTIDENRMRELNARVERDRQNFRAAADGYFEKSSANVDPSSQRPFFDLQKGRIVFRTKEHLILVGLALLFSLVLGVPLGILATQSRAFGQLILLVSGVFQTIPSLALLCFLIPLFGIGIGSSLIALCMYGLLPVVMNTFVGLRSIDRNLLDTANALGLNYWQSLFRVRLPLASRSIYSGLRTSAITGIGTATLAALIGAGGYGATILAGLAINDIEMITLGAAPAALMALAVHGIFELIDARLIPKGLR